MKKIVILFCLLLNFLILAWPGSEVFAQFSLELTLKNNPFTQAYFCSVHGDGMKVLYSTKVNSTKISINYKGNLPTGLYRLYLSDTVFIDIVGGADKKIKMESVAATIADSLKVLEGNDNRIYYAYIQYRNRQLETLSSLMTLIKPGDSKKLNPLAEERIGFMQGCTTYKVNAFADSIYALDTNAFGSKLVRAQVVPNANLEMLKNPGGKFYNNDIEFLLVHFFDNIDFSDTSFLNTEIYYRTVKYYVEKILQPRNVTGFNYGNEFILQKASANKKVHRFVLSELFDLYEYSQLEEVYLNLYENYLLKDTLAVTNDRLTEIKRKAGIIKSRSIGSIAPDISGLDTLGNTIKLSDIKSKIIMLFIWKPSNSHSLEAMKQLTDIYEKYKKYNFEIFSFALDTSQTHLSASLHDLKNDWINVSDFSGSQSPVCSQYNTWSLPGIYILDENLKIIAKPMNMDYVIKEFEKLEK